MSKLDVVKAITDIEFRNQFMANNKISVEEMVEFMDGMSAECCPAMSVI